MKLLEEGKEKSTAQASLEEVDMLTDSNVFDVNAIFAKLDTLYSSFENEAHEAFLHEIAGMLEESIKEHVEILKNHAKEVLSETVTPEEQEEK